MKTWYCFTKQINLISLLNMVNILSRLVEWYRQYIWILANHFTKSLTVHFWTK